MESVHAQPEFPAAFGFSDTRRIGASDALRDAMCRLQRMPSRPPRRVEDIPAARFAFDTAVTAALLAQRSGDAPESPGAVGHLERFDGVPVLCVAPPGDIRGALIHIHGGGWCLGDPWPLLPALARLAQATSTLVASIDYRLAPEHRHPAGLEDCVRASRSLLDRWRLGHGLDSRRVFVAGESAGAHLALLAMLRLRDEGVALAGASLAYGLYDLSNALPSRATATGSPLLDGDACRFYTDAYLGDEGRVDEASSPWQLPVSAFNALPPALFCVGTADPLYDDSVGMHARWLAAGNDAWRIDYEEAPHAFDLLPVPEAGHMAGIRAAFVRYCLGEDSMSGRGALQL